ncbi:hypothetical protein D0Z62_16360 [Providencia rettgeri]|nr:hypothetical protein D0Z62_16360 [Providencia rettgeri]
MLLGISSFAALLQLKLFRVYTLEGVYHDIQSCSLSVLLNIQGICFIFIAQPKLGVFFMIEN